MPRMSTFTLSWRPCLGDLIMMRDLSYCSIDNGHHNLGLAKANKNQAASRLGCHDSKPSWKETLDWKLKTYVMVVYLTLASTPLHSMVTSGLSPPKSSLTSAAICSALFSLVAFKQQFMDRSFVDFWPWTISDWTLSIRHCLFLK